MVQELMTRLSEKEVLVLNTWSRQPLIDWTKLMEDTFLSVAQLEQLLLSHRQFLSTKHQALALFQSPNEYKVSHIAQMLDVSISRIAQILKEEGISVAERRERATKKADEQMKARLLQLAKEGKSRKEIAILLDVTERKITLLATEIGLNFNALRALKREEKLQKILAYVQEGKTSYEISQILGMREQSVRNEISRARKEGKFPPAK